MTWYSPAGKPRDLVFTAFVQRPREADSWHPIAAGSYAAVQEEAHHFAATHHARVLIIALSIDATAPEGIGEKALLRMGQPWY